MNDELDGVTLEAGAVVELVGAEEELDEDTIVLDAGAVVELAGIKDEEPDDEGDDNDNELLFEYDAVIKEVMLLDRGTMVGGVLRTDVMLVKFEMPGGGGVVIDITGIETFVTPGREEVIIAVTEEFERPGTEVEKLELEELAKELPGVVGKIGVKLPLPAIEAPEELLI